MSQRKLFWQQARLPIGESVELLRAKGPATFWLNLVNFRAGDMADIELRLYGDGIPTKSVLELHSVQLQNMTDKGLPNSYLLTNGTPILKEGKLLPLDIPAGPWETVVTYEQTQGVGPVLISFIVVPKGAE